MSAKLLILTLIPVIFQVCTGLKIFENLKYEVEFKQTVVDVEPSGQVSEKCMACICQVESGCNKAEGCKMDAGSLSCGPFQIKKPYWIDCGKPQGDYETCAKNYQCSYNCVEKYMEKYAKYAKKLGCPDNCETYARMHNGGPKGCIYPSTLPYWKRILKQGCTPDS